MRVSLSIDSESDDESANLPGNLEVDDATEALAVMLQSGLDHVLRTTLEIKVEDVTLERIAHELAQYVFEDGGVCFYEEHRAPYAHDENDPGKCCVCGKLPEEHELVRCCAEGEGGR